MSTKHEPTYTISIKIPTMHFIKKYLAKKAPVEPFKLTNRQCHITAIVIEPIAKEFYPGKEPLPEKFDDYIEFDMNTSLIKEGRFHIDRKIVFRINRLLRDKFDDEMYHFVQALVDCYRLRGDSIEINECLKMFRTYYNIEEDDLPEETMIKSYYRDRVPPVYIKRPTKEELQKQLTMWDVPQ